MKNPCSMSISLLSMFDFIPSRSQVKDVRSIPSRAYVGGMFHIKSTPHC